MFGLAGIIGNGPAGKLISKNAAYQLAEQKPSDHMIGSGFFRRGPSCQSFGTGQNPGGGACTLFYISKMTRRWFWLAGARKTDDECVGVLGDWKPTVLRLMEGEE